MKAEYEVYFKKDEFVNMLDRIEEVMDTMNDECIFVNNHGFNEYIKAKRAIDELRLTVNIKCTEGRAKA